MKKLISSLNTTTGWTGTGAGTVISTITHENFIAGLNTQSVMIKFDGADAVRSAKLTISPAIDVTGFNNLIINTWSQNYKLNRYLKKDDFAYKIKVNGTAEFYLKTGLTLQDWTIGIDGVTSIDRIEITPVHAETDYIVLSECVVEVEQVLYDILSETKVNIEYFLNAVYGNGIVIATGFTGTAGDLSINIPGTRYFMERYAVIKIVQGAVSETHQLYDNDEANFFMHGTHDGKALLNTFTAATVYLTFPVMINPTQDDVRLPGISVWGMDPEPYLLNNKEDHNWETFTTTAIKGRKEGQLLRHMVKINLEARHYELLEKMAVAVRRMIGRHAIWVNGRRHEAFFEGRPEEQFPQQGIDILPGMTYNMRVESMENLYERDTFSLAQDPTLTVEVQ
jgi:hypothetical protein